MQRKSLFALAAAVIVGAAALVPVLWPGDSYHQGIVQAATTPVDAADLV